MRIIGGQKKKNRTQVRTMIFASGSGTNFEAIVTANRADQINLEIVALVCNQPDAKVFERARTLGVESILLSHHDYESRVDFDMALSKILIENRIELVILAGWMRLLSSEFLRIHPKVLNIHPSILPAFRGLGAIERAHSAEVEETGCTVHQVVPKMDSGPIIAQAFVKTEGLNLSDLEKRVHEAEHILYPQAIAFFLDNELTLKKKIDLDSF